MAQHFTHLRVSFSPADRQAFLDDCERIVRKYGDHPHTQKQRDAEIMRAVGVFADGVELKPIRKTLRSPSTGRSTL